MPTEFQSFRSDAEDLLRVEGPGFTLAFHKEGDRWIESIRGDSGELVRALIGEPNDPARVPHPVYQEWQLHGPESGASLCLLLTGLSFTHHFSAALTIAADPVDPAAVRLDFDVADRCRSPVESLAATYLLDLGSNALASADPERIAWEVPNGRLELLAGPGASLAMAEAGRRATRAQIVATIEPGAFTHRLRYGWRWTIASDRTR